MAATPETGFLVIADLTGYTAYLSGSEMEHAPGDRRRPARDDRRPPGAAIPPGEVRGRRRLPVRRGRPRRRIVAPRCDRGVVRRVPASAPEHRPGDQLRVQFVPACAPARPQAVHPPRLVRPSRIAGRDELAGADVILVHRLLKGAGATAATATASRCSRPARSKARARTGRARARSGGGIDRAPRAGRHLHPRPRGPLAGRDRSAPPRSRMTPTGARHRGDVAAEPSVVWAHLTSPSLRTRWEGRCVIERVAGRTARSRDDSPSA